MICLSTKNDFTGDIIADGSFTEGLTAGIDSLTTFIVMGYLEKYIRREEVKEVKADLI